MFKSLFDKLLALFFIFLLFPVFILISMLIRWKIGRPVFYKQERAGYKGKVFTLYKFRTMTNEKDENEKLLPDAQRLQEIGKFIRSTSLDELPQLLNILKGEMSFIGPRPLLVEYLPLYNDTQKRRHDIKPGITGLAQVKGRNAISWEKKFKYDVWYVDHRSFCLDMKILWMTLLRIWDRSGIDSDAEIPMDKFKGYDI